MKKIIVVILFALFTFSCSPTSITNDEIIKEKKKCEDAGMCYEIIYSGLNYKPIRVICTKCK